MGLIDFNKVIKYSRTKCFEKSKAKCASYVKTAFQQGGCEYIRGNGWSNQTWCQKNGFMLIGDFLPVYQNPRKAVPETDTICIVNGLQFPKMADGSPYVQQTGDVCLIKHGIYGHICYAMSENINDWVSDFFQRPPGQKENTGPYCYSGNVERVQIWRHVSVLKDAPTISAETRLLADTMVNTSSSVPTISGASNRVFQLASAAKPKENVLNQNEDRKSEFESLRSAMTSNAPQMGRDIIMTSELYDSNILKSGQESRKERS